MRLVVFAICTFNLANATFFPSPSRSAAVFRYHFGPHRGRVTLWLRTLRDIKPSARKHVNATPDHMLITTVNTKDVIVRTRHANREPEGTVKVHFDSQATVRIEGSYLRLL